MVDEDDEPTKRSSISSSITSIISSFEELDEVVDVVVDSGNIEGQIAAPMAPIAIPTGKAIPSSCLVSLLRFSGTSAGGISDIWISLYQL